MLPFVQVETDFITGKAPRIAALAGIPRAMALGYSVELIAFIIPETSSKEQPPTGVLLDPDAAIILEGVVGWTGPAGRLFDAWVRGGLVEKLEIGARVKGLDRYVEAWETAKRSRDRARAWREAQRNGTKPEANAHRTRTKRARTPGDGDGDGDQSLPSEEKKESAPPALALTAPEPVGRPADPAREVFDHWVQVHQATRAKFTRDRERKVRARLGEGYSAAELKRAVDGNAASAWHREKQQHDLELICRDGAHVDRFMREADQAQPAEVPEGSPPIPQPDTPAGKAWAAVLGRLRDDGKRYALGWLEKLEPVGLLDQVLELRTEDAYALDWYREHYGGLLVELLAEDGLTLNLNLTAPAGAPETREGSAA